MTGRMRGAYGLLPWGLIALGVLHMAASPPALRWFCRGVSVVILCFATFSGLVGNASAVQLVLVVSLIGAIALLSFSQAAVTPHQRES